MHIKAFLKKIADNPISDRFNISRDKSKNQLKTKLQYGALKNNLHSSRQPFFKSVNCNDSTIKYIENHNPVIKERLNRGYKLSITPQKSESKIFRQKIQERLALLMNQRKDLIVTRSSRKESVGSIRYNSQKQLPREKKEWEVPQFMKNIMKPCRVASVKLIQRPKSSYPIPPVKSQPKIYCKKLLPSRQRQSKRTISSKSSRVFCKSPESIPSSPWKQLKGWNQDNHINQQSIELLASKV